MIQNHKTYNYFYNFRYMSIHYLHVGPTLYIINVKLCNFVYFNVNFWFFFTIQCERKSKIIIIQTVEYEV